MPMISLAATRTTPRNPVAPELKLAADRSIIMAVFSIACAWPFSSTAASVACNPVCERVNKTRPRADSPFNTTLREMREMRYLWEQTIEMDNSKLIAFLGHEPQTPLTEAVRSTLAGLGCI